MRYRRVDHADRDGAHAQNWFRNHIARQHIAHLGRNICGMVCFVLGIAIRRHVGAGGPRIAVAFGAVRRTHVRRVRRACMGALARTFNGRNHGSGGFTLESRGFSVAVEGRHFLRDGVAADGFGSSHWPRHGLVL